MYTPVLPNELKLWQHQYGPEQVLNGLGGWLGARALVFGSPRNRSVGGVAPEQVNAIAMPFFRRLGAIARLHGVG